MPLFSLVLASSSSARRMLLERLQIPFEVASPDIDETPHLHESPQSLVDRLTREKGRAIQKRFPEHLIISADQVIVVRGEAISKPESKEDAVRQLLNESGQWIEALSGLGLLNAQTAQYQYVCVKTRVLFRKISLEEIEAYLAKEPSALLAAGSLKVEGLGISLLEKIETDDPTALIGLPLIALMNMLRSSGTILI